MSSRRLGVKPIVRRPTALVGLGEIDLSSQSTYRRRAESGAFLLPRGGSDGPELALLTRNAARTGPTDEREGRSAGPAVCFGTARWAPRHEAAKFRRAPSLLPSLAV